MSIVGLGTDLVELARIRHALERFGERFLTRCYTPQEIAFCRLQQDPVPRLAARYAAKEAAAKALGTGIARGILWKEIEVLRQPGHAPRLVLHGRAQQRAEALGSGTAHVTLSHAREIAGATVILERAS